MAYKCDQKKGTNISDNLADQKVHEVIYEQWVYPTILTILPGTTITFLGVLPCSCC